MNCTSNTNQLSMYRLMCLFLISYNPGISATLFITDTSIHGRKMVWVDVMTFYLFLCYCQYQILYISEYWRIFIWLRFYLSFLLAHLWFGILVLFMVHIGILSHKSSFWLNLLHKYHHIYLTILGRTYLH